MYFALRPLVGVDSAEKEAIYFKPRSNEHGAKYNNNFGHGISLAQGASRLVHKHPTVPIWAWAQIGWGVGCLTIETHPKVDKEFGSSSIGAVCV